MIEEGETMERNFRFQLFNLIQSSCPFRSVLAKEKKRRRTRREKEPLSLDLLNIEHFHTMECGVKNLLNKS